MKSSQTLAADYLSCIFGPNYLVHEGDWLCNFVDLEQAVIEPGGGEFFENVWCSLAITRKADGSLACILYNDWEYVSHGRWLSDQSELEQFEKDNGLLILCPRSETYLPLEGDLTRRDMQLLLAQASGYPYDLFEGEANAEDMESLFGDEPPSVEGIEYPFESAEKYDSESGQEVIRSLMRNIGTPRLFVELQS